MVVGRRPTFVSPWRTNGEYAILRCELLGARDSRTSDALTQGEIDELRRNLSRLSADSVERFYREAHAECAVEHQPSAKLIQRLVTAWRVLRKWNWR